MNRIENYIRKRKYTMEDRKIQSGFDMNTYDSLYDMGIMICDDFLTKIDEIRSETQSELEAEIITYVEELSKRADKFADENYHGIAEALDVVISDIEQIIGRV